MRIQRPLRIQWHADPGWILSQPQLHTPTLSHAAMSVTATLFTAMFAADGSTKVAYRCNACPKVFPYHPHQSTGNFSKHYRKKHKEEWRTYEQPEDEGASIISSSAASSQTLLSPPGPPLKRSSASASSISSPPPARQRTLQQTLKQSGNHCVLQQMALCFATNHIAYHVASSDTFIAFVDAVRRSTVPLPGRGGQEPDEQAGR